MYRRVPALRSRVSYLILFLTIAGCAAKREVVFLAASNQTVTSRLDVSHDGNAQRVLVTNASTVEVTVTSVQLRDCENIKNRCEVVKLRTPIAPGQTREVLVVMPKDRDQRWNFRYSWSWEAANNAPPMPR